MAAASSRRSRRGGSARVDAGRVLRDRETYVEYLTAFIEASPTSYHAAAALAAALHEERFTEYQEADAWPAVVGGARGYVRRDGALIAWRAGEGVDATSAVRVLGCHTDSPGFVLKPQPDTSAVGWAQLGVEIYGGPLLNSWLDRDLEVAGRLVTRDGSEYLSRTGAVARIPQLAIHLDREANSGLTLDRQRHTQPVIGLEAVEGRGIVELLAEAAGVEAQDVVGIDARLADTQAPGRIGRSAELFAAARLDNLSSVAAGLAALTATEPAPGTIAVLAAFDHEELGSETRSGASGPFLADVLERLWGGLGAGVEERARALAQSWCLSADAGHSVHPNYAEKHDPNVRPIAGGGPMLKVNANQRYASDAHGAALWQRICEAGGVTGQVFVSNNSSPCGTTIGPLTATRLGIRTVDVGVPLLSMHSARELAAIADLHGLALITSAFFSDAAQ